MFVAPLRVSTKTKMQNGAFPVFGATMAQGKTIKSILQYLASKVTSV